MSLWLNGELFILIKNYYWENIMQPIYLNTAATSAQKWPYMIEHMTAQLQLPLQVNLNRNGPLLIDEADIMKTRRCVAQFFNATSPLNVVFTSGVTLSLNMVLQGILDKGDHVVTTSLEHNAVLRTLYLLQSQKKIELTIVQANQQGVIAPEQIMQAVKNNTRVVVMTHASNVLGTMLPVKTCFHGIKKQYPHIITIVDVAQTAGHTTVDMQDLQADVVAFTGHKGLMGLAGIGGFILAPYVVKDVKPWLVGGTGSLSQDREMPSAIPDKFEAGTQNHFGILSLYFAIQALQKVGLKAIEEKEKTLMKAFLNGLQKLPVRIHGTQDIVKSSPVISITTNKMSPAILCEQLYDTYNIITRSGLHCAPLAHKTAGTFPEGTLRFSFGYFNTLQEIDATLSALKNILSQ